MERLFIKKIRVDIKKSYIIMIQGLKMNTAVIIIIFIVALLISVGFLILVLTLVPAINQLRSLLFDLEKTSSEVRDLTFKLKGISEKVDEDIDKVDSLLNSSKKTIDVVSKSANLINKNILKRSAGIFTLFSALKFGWNFAKKIKGGK